MTRRALACTAGRPPGQRRDRRSLPGGLRDVLATGAVQPPIGRNVETEVTMIVAGGRAIAAVGTNVSIGGRSRGARAILGAASKRSTMAVTRPTTDRASRKAIVRAA